MLNSRPGDSASAQQRSMFAATRRTVRWTSRIRLILIAIVYLIGPVRSFAQLPATQLDGISPLGAGANESFELKISGVNLDDVDRLEFSHVGIVAKQKMSEPTRFDDGPQPVDNTFEVTIGNDVPPGKYQVRCQGKYGLSNARLFVVGTMAEATETEPNNDTETATAATAPVVLNGHAAENADVDWYEITGVAGQQIFIDGQAQQLDSLMNLVLTAFDQSGDILQEARAGAGSDPVLGIVVPSDGKIRLKVHDAQYRQGNGYGYRIAVTVRPHIDFVFPPAASAGQTETFTVYGRHLPGGQPSDLKIDGVPLQQTSVQITTAADAAGQLNFSGRIDPHVAGCDGFEYRIMNGTQSSNPVLMTLAGAPVVREQPDNNRPETAQTLSFPCEVAGQFYPQRDVDWYTFDAVKDQTLVIDLYSQRLGLSTDPALLVQQVTKKDDGTEQVRDVVFLDDVAPPTTRNESGRHEFETRSSDPTYLFKAPADATYRLLVRDGYSSLHNDPRLVYRLVVRAPQHDFRLIAVPAESPSSLQLRRDGREVVRIFAERNDGFDGEITVKAEGLPEGVSCEEIVIGPSNRMGTLVLTASDQAQPTTASIQISGSATIEGRAVVHQARFGAASVAYRMGQPNSILPNVPARITSDLQLCVTDVEPAPALLTIGDGQPLETSRGMSVKIKYTAAKRDGIGGTFMAFPMDFPANTAAAQVNIGDNKAGEFELKFNANSPAGEYSIYLAGYLQNMPYKRNPEAVDIAKKQQERVQKIQDEANTESQETAKTVQTKQNELNQANTNLTAAKTAKQTADQNLTTATSQMTAAQKTKDDRQKQSEATPDDEALKKQFAEAEAAFTVAATNMQQAKEAADAAEKTLEEATAQQTAATDAKTAADKAAADARTFVQDAQREKQRIDQFVRQKEQESAQRNINVVIPSNSFRLKLAEFPIELTDQPAEPSVKQGEPLEIPLKFIRSYDYKGNFSVQVQLPAGVSGISIGNINIAADKTDEVLKVTTAPTATVGKHTINLRCTMNLNGSLVMDRPLVLNVVEVPKEE